MPSQVAQYGALLKNPPANVGDAEDSGLIPGSGRYTPSHQTRMIFLICIRNPTINPQQTRRSYSPSPLHSNPHSHTLAAHIQTTKQEEMATHSSILAWRIPWSEEPGGLQSMGSQRVGHNWAAEQTHTQEIAWTTQAPLSTDIFF